MKKLKLGIIFDSFVCHDEEYIKNNNWHKLCLNIDIDGKTYIDDGINLSIEELSILIYKGNDVKTSLPNLNSIIRLMKKASEMYEKVVVFPTSSKLSGTYSVIKAQANKYKNIYVYDLKLVGDQYVILAKKVEKMFEQDSSNFARINQYIKYYNEKSRVFIIPKTVDRIIKSGRLQGIGKLFVRGLNLYLVLLFDGKPKVVALKRSLRASYKLVVQKLIKFIGDFKNLKNYNFFLTHSSDPKLLKLAREAIKKVGVNSFYSELHSSPVILAHVGEGSISIAVSPKINDKK